MHSLWSRVSNLTLWPRMALAISLGFLVLFAAMSLLGEQALRDSTNHVFEERLVVAQIAANQMDGLLLRAVHELEEIPDLVEFDPADPDLSAEAEVLAHVSREIGIFPSGIIILNTAGRVVLSHPSDLYSPGTEIPELPYPDLDGNDVTISVPFREPINNRPVTAVTVAIHNNNNLMGFITGLVGLQDQAITEILNQTTVVGKTTHATLVDSQGRVLASTLNLPFLAPGEHPTFYQQVMIQGKPTVDTVLLENDQDTSAKAPDELHVQALAPLSEAPWGLSVGGNEDEILSGVWHLRLSLGLLGSAALITVWVTTLFGTRRLIRPIHRLTEAAQQIANGKLSTPLTISEMGEIGAMSTALEYMRRQLLHNIEELAGWNETLETRVSAQTRQIRRHQALTQQILRRTITAQEEERARISLELHDEIGQMLTALGLSLDRVTDTLGTEDAKTRNLLNRSRDITEQLVTNSRRLIAALRPGVLDKLGLAPALKWVSDQTLHPLDMAVNIENNLQERLPGEIETILFRIAQEAINNVARHSQAGCLSIRLGCERGQVTMSLSDDGQGFDPTATSSEPDHSQELGLAGMQERASLAGGRVMVDSSPGQGTIVRVVIPLATAEVKEYAL